MQSGETRRNVSGSSALPKAKAVGNNSMAEKQEVSEDAEGTVLQDSRDKVKAGLPESQSPGVQRHTHDDSVLSPCPLEPNDARLRTAISASRTMPHEGIQGDEWGT